MIVTIHQPEHMPWLGFFYKMKRADCMVFLDNVAFRKNYFQNRNRILTGDGVGYLTVPVLSGSGDRIRDIRIRRDGRFMKKYLNKLYYAYRRHPHFDAVFEPVERLLSADTELLATLNISLIEYMARELGIAVSFVKASELSATGSKSELLLNICKEVGADTYLSGPAGKLYLDERAFQRSGIGVTYDPFRHPVYPQLSRFGFVSHLSAIDLLFNCGDDSGSYLT